MNVRTIVNQQNEVHDRLEVAVPYDKITRNRKTRINREKQNIKSGSASLSRSWVHPLRYLSCLGSRV